MKSIIVGKWDNYTDYVFTTNCEDYLLTGEIITNAECLCEVMDRDEGETFEEACEWYGHDPEEITMGVPVDELEKDISIEGLATKLFEAQGYTAEFTGYLEYNRACKCWEV